MSSEVRWVVSVSDIVINRQDCAMFVYGNAVCGLIEECSNNNTCMGTAIVYGVEVSTDIVLVSNMSAYGVIVN